MEANRLSAVERRARRRSECWVVVIASGWGWAIYTFLLRTGLYDALDEASAPFHESLAGLVLFLMVLPVTVAAHYFALTSPLPTANGPRFVRMFRAVFGVIWKGMAVGSSYVLLLGTVPLLPPSAVIAGCIVGAVVMVWAGVQLQTRRSAAARTVAALYESVKNGDLDAVEDLCEPSAIESLRTMEAEFGRLSWYHVRECAMDADQIELFVETVRERMPKFEEITVSNDGRRVIRATAAGI